MPAASAARALFVVSVRPGSDGVVCERIKKLAGPEVVKDCFALAYQILKKYQGVWRLCTENMFPGYLFVETDDIEAVQERLALSSSPLHLLGIERQAFSLRAEEATFIHDFGGTRHVVGMSRGVIEQGVTRIDAGPLCGRSNLIQRIDRHKRMAYLDVGLLDQRQIKVGLEIASKT